jgi:hypothetical protein
VPFFSSWFGLLAVWGLPGAEKGFHAAGCHSSGPVTGRERRWSRMKKLAFFVFFEKNKLIFFECQQNLATKTPDNGAFKRKDQKRGEGRASPGPAPHEEDSDDACDR